MRITGGELCSRSVSVPDLKIPGFRPTTDFMREVIFSSIQNYFSLSNIKVLDLYAGSGIFSFECLSRGAKHCVLVELNKKLCKNIKNQAILLGLNDSITVVNEDARKFNFSSLKFDLIFADPPYGSIDFKALTEELILKTFFSSNSLYIYEDSSKNIDRIFNNKEYQQVSALTLRKKKTFGDSGILIFTLKF